MVLSKEQKTAVHFKDGPALVLAGPGSGKTTVIVNRVEYLIKNYNVEPSNILVITFTKAAAKSMKQRFLSLMGDSYVSVTFGTFHAVFFTILRHAYNYSANSIITADMQYRFIRDAAISFELEYPDEKEMVQNILSEISCVKNEKIDINSYEATSCPIETFRIIYKNYEKMLLQSRRIDYDDMIIMCYELLKQRKDYRQAWQNKYKYILIDEFQDINKAQFETIKLIAGENANLFAVGDDDQSIYAFRGSKPEIMLGYSNEYKNAVTINLDMNYRCPLEIVAASKSLIDCNKDRYYKNISSKGAAFGNIKLCTLNNIEQEGTFIITEVKKLIKAGMSLSDIAIISRTNIISEIYYTRLTGNFIPCSMLARKQNIYDYWLVEDILSYIRAAVDKDNTESIIRIINKPLRYIKRSLIKHPFTYEALRKSYEGNGEMISVINDLQFDIGMLKKMSPYAAVNYILNGIGYKKYIEEQIISRRLNKDEVNAKLEQFISEAKRFDNVKKWLEYIETYKENDSDSYYKINKNYANKDNKENMEKDALNIYTMHSCKGLEFKVVFITDVCDGIIPYNRAVLDSEIEEERRLMYVAMTRTKEKLYLLYPKERYGKDTAISRFINEIDNSYIENYSFSESSCS